MLTNTEQPQLKSRS